MKFGNLNLSIDNDKMNNIFNRYRSIYADLSTFISEEIKEYDPSKYEEELILEEVSNGVFASFYNVCILQIHANYKDKRIEHRLITAMIKFMNKYGYKEYLNRSNDTKLNYSRDYGIISTDGNNISIIMHVSDFYGIMRFSVTIFYNDTNTVNKISDKKENKYMCFDEAYAKMLEGHKITRPCFKGYWYINGVTGKPTIHLANGEEITSGDLSITLPNVLAKDWIVLE